MSGKGPEKQTQQVEGLQSAPEGSSDVNTLKDEACDALDACEVTTLQQVQEKAPDSVDKATDQLSAAKQLAMLKLDEEAATCQQKQAESASNAAQNCSLVLAQFFKQ